MKLQVASQLSWSQKGMMKWGSCQALRVSSTASRAVIRGGGAWVQRSVTESPLKELSTATEETTPVEKQPTASGFSPNLVSISLRKYCSLVTSLSFFLNSMLLRSRALWKFLSATSCQVRRPYPLRTASSSWYLRRRRSRMISAIPRRLFLSRTSISWRSSLEACLQMIWMTLSWIISSRAASRLQVSGSPFTAQQLSGGTLPMICSSKQLTRFIRCRNMSISYLSSSLFISISSNWFLERMLKASCSDPTGTETHLSLSTVLSQGFLSLPLHCTGYISGIFTQEWVARRLFEKSMSLRGLKYGVILRREISVMLRICLKKSCWAVLSKNLAGTKFSTSCLLSTQLSYSESSFSRNLNCSVAIVSPSRLKKNTSSLTPGVGAGGAAAAGGWGSSQGGGGTGFGGCLPWRGSGESGLLSSARMAAHISGRSSMWARMERMICCSLRSCWSKALRNSMQDRKRSLVGSPLRREITSSLMSPTSLPDSMRSSSSRKQFTCSTIFLTGLRISANCTKQPSVSSFSRQSSSSCLTAPKMPGSIRRMFWHSSSTFFRLGCFTPFIN